MVSVSDLKEKGSNLAEEPEHINDKGNWVWGSIGLPAISAGKKEKK